LYAWLNEVRADGSDQAPLSSPWPEQPFVYEITRPEGDGIHSLDVVRLHYILPNNFAAVHSSVETADCVLNGGVVLPDRSIRRAVQVSLFLMLQ